MPNLQLPIMSIEIPWLILTREMRNIYKDRDIEKLLIQDYDPHEDVFPFNKSEYILSEEYEGRDLTINGLLADQEPDGRYITFDGRYITFNGRYITYRLRKLYHLQPH